MDADKRRQLRDAFGAFMTGVTVVTSVDKHNKPIGFTANSFSSVSLDPALLLVSIDKRSANLDNFTQCSHFAINILSEQQKETSNIFAQRIDDRFALIDWRWSDAGVPLIDHSSAWFDCALHQVVDAGDHAILIGRVEQFESNATAGLGYYRGAYFTPYQNSESLITSPTVVVSALIEFDGQAVMVKQSDGSYGLPSCEVGERSVSETLDLLMNQLAIGATPGFVYSIYDDRLRHKQHIVFLCALPTEAGSMTLAMRHAEWFTLESLVTMPIKDTALQSMMNRFVRENAVGNYSIYYGDENQGAIKQFAS
ncbi:flavin reductase family protein [Serratia sp. AKBS12]|uniref:flavin reductase family protein n=1 Tax=Serratia sp. AKBS12 TaxID=2974597 RepID=UPI00216526D9|nr:flavin reductase [Serratia sp. AKBS12]MCS3408707.1 flavin reductase [Serratia sp. AKBS12]HEI8865045.1 flavin reductase [Serratia odorifera]HEI8869091.1 flavin reductase [Serratia odorifera]